MYGFDGDFAGQRNKQHQPKKQTDLGSVCFLGLVVLSFLVLCAQVYLLVSYIGTY